MAYAEKDRVVSLIRGCCFAGLLAIAGCPHELDSPPKPAHAPASHTSTPVERRGFQPSDDADPQQSPDTWGDASVADANGSDAPPADVTEVTHVPDSHQDDQSVVSEIHDDVSRDSDASLPPLPAPSAGPCAFEPAPVSAPVVDDPRCTDGIARGDFTLTTAADVNALRGCTRVAGNLTITLENGANVEALASLRVVEGNLFFDGHCYGELDCRGPNDQLANLHGLENLRCTGGDFTITRSNQGYNTPLDISALGNLIEVGGSFRIYPTLGGADANKLDSLRRVWGGISSAVDISLPRLETVYGGVWREGGEPFARDVYIGCANEDDLCRDGVLGCSFTAQSQAQLAKLSKCEIAVQGISVSGADITDLSALSKLRSVRGALSFGNPFDTKPGALASLAGLESLKSVRGISFTRLPRLANLHGLSGLTSVGGLKLFELDALVDLTGLEGIPSLTSLEISGNDALKTLDGLGARGPTPWILITYNPALASIQALDGMHGPTSMVGLSNLPSLTSLAGLSNIPTIQGLWIEQCDALKDLSGLDGLHDVEYLDLRENASLRSLRALAELRTASQGGITDNPVLADCEVAAFTMRFPALESFGNDPDGVCCEL